MWAIRSPSSHFLLRDSLWGRMKKGLSSYFSHSQEMLMGAVRESAIHEEQLFNAITAIGYHYVYLSNGQQPGFSG